MCDLVSILIPAYNAGKWIKQTINSVLSQTWPQKEIIIVNDGSVDETLAIAKTFESKSVKVVSQENRGASAARNRAYSFAQGEYIQWLDADDLLARNKISAQMKVAEKEQSSLTLYSSAHGVFHWRPQKARFKDDFLWQDLTPIQWMIKTFSYNLWMSPAVYLMNRKLAEKGGPWNEALSLNDDGEYFFRIISMSERVKFVREARSYYRLSGFGQLSMSASEKACESLFLSLDLSIRHLRSLEDSERTRRVSLAALQKSLYRFYPERAELVEKINALASELGGKLSAPNHGWKFDFVRSVFGWKTANWVMPALRKLKLSMIVKWDELLYRIALSSRSGNGVLKSCPSDEDQKSIDFNNLDRNAKE